MSGYGRDTGYVPPRGGGYGQVAPSAQVPPGPPPPYPVGPPVPPSRGRLRDVLLVLAVLLAAAALVVGIVGLVRQPAQPSAAPSTPSVSTAPSDTKAADKELCQAIAPLMQEATNVKKAFVNLGHSGTPERDNGIPQFQTTMSDWANRAQKTFDNHAGSPRYLTRMVQRYIDDMRAYAASIRPGPANDADAAAWNDALVALGGPFEICPTVGVQWW